VLKEDGTPLSPAELGVNRRGDGRVVPEGGIDEAAAVVASALARAGRSTVRTRQLVCSYADDGDAGRFATVSCNICANRLAVGAAGRAEWRVAVSPDGTLENGVLHKMRSHCGQFASVRHASTLEHCVALGKLGGRAFSTRMAAPAGAARAARSPPSGGGGGGGGGDRPRVARSPRRAPDSARSTPAKRAKPGLRSGRSPARDDAPRLQIYDVNAERFVDIKRDAGRGIRYHRLRHRLRSALEAGGGGLAGAPVVAPAEAEAAGGGGAPGGRRRRGGRPRGGPGGGPGGGGGGGGGGDPARATSARCLALAALLLERGFVEKLPVTRAADVRALGDARAALEARPDLADVVVAAVAAGDQGAGGAAAQAACCAAAADATFYRRRERMALLLVAHQLWTPSRTRRFLDGLGDDAADDAARDAENARAACGAAADAAAHAAAGRRSASRARR